ncbi:Sulfotransferase family protein [Algoriphagus locisalis]|uniref:Sulfotransferase family protein n=1 Tax=Algoriphagus locisalis TaxID=305507 RepID=A0A1I6Y5G5_9BACT|nr:sulfotransferase [Algoriphagus locisalis]SFT45647.1 Sulfotransferase family protein [Algoriphagus locisalis]
MLDRPIFLIGAARSGTTLLGDILSKHHDLAYWIEPKYIWKYKSPNILNDYRFKDDVDDDIRKFIYNRFNLFLKKCKKSRFIEKTPSNCFRIPFIDSIFPNAIYINIIRDGRDVTISAYKKWTFKHDTSAYERRLSFNEFPLIDFPYYLFHFVKQFVIQQFYPNELRMWGPMSPSIITYLNKSIEEACAYQWRESTETSINDLSKIDQNRVINIRYEDLLSDPCKHLNEIFKVCKLSNSNETILYAENIIKSNNSNKWLNNKFIDKVSYILDPTLEKLGYL